MTPSTSIRTLHIDQSSQTGLRENVRLCRNVRKTLEEQYEDWKKRNFLEKSMMRKDFAKCTDMSIDDMVSILEKLEDSLLNQRPIMKFLEPLRKLAVYQRKAQNHSQLVGNGRSRLTEAELLVNVIVNDAQRMLLDTITSGDTEYGQTRTDVDDNTSSFPVLEYYEKSVKEGQTDVDDNTSSFPVLEYYEESRRSPAPCRPLVVDPQPPAGPSPTVSFSSVWSDEALPKVKYLVTV